MSDVDSEKERERADRMAARKRYNMKALGALVDSNRLTGVSRPDDEEHSGPHRRDAADELVDDIETADAVEFEAPTDVEARQDDDEAAAAELVDATDLVEEVAPEPVAPEPAVAEDDLVVAEPSLEPETAGDGAPPEAAVAEPSLEPETAGDGAPPEAAVAEPEATASELAELYESGAPAAIEPEPLPATPEPTIELRARSRPKVDRRAAPDLDDDALRGRRRGPVGPRRKRHPDRSCRARRPGSHHHPTGPARLRSAPGTPDAR